MYLVLALMASSMSVLAADNQSTPLVSGGIKVQANASNLLLNDVPTKPLLHTTMNAGGELGGFVDFNIKEHFLIQLNLLGVATHNDLREDTQHSKLWSIGLEIPLYFLGRYGSDTRGYISFGGGPYANFNIWGHLSGDMPTANPYLKTYTNADGEQLAALHNFHSGLAALIGYELPCGLQINASYQIAFSDMFAFEHAATTFLLPQKVSLGLGYRFNRK